MGERNESRVHDADLSWLTAVRMELERFRRQRNESVLSLRDVYSFSEQRLAGQFSENNHIRAKIRQALQQLQERGKIEFLDNRGMYRISDLQLNDSMAEAVARKVDSEGTGETDSVGLYLVPVNEEWRDRFRESVEEPHNLKQYANIPPQLAGSDHLRVWGTTVTDSPQKQQAIDRMQPNDCLLFYYDGEFIGGGRVRRIFESSEVGALLWDNPESRYIFTVEGFTRDVPPIEYVWELLGYDGRPVVQGFTRSADNRVSTIRESYGSLEAALLGGEATSPSTEAIEQEKTELEAAVTSEPVLTADETQYVGTKRLARDRAFTELVREAYNNTCAICGSQRESPTGSPEAEAAHIYPKAAGGRDDVRNGVALCKLHHWAFDTGWLSVTNDHEIIVADAPAKNGYDEMNQLEGQSLNLPDANGVWPHPLYLEQHQQIHGFDR